MNLYKLTEQFIEDLGGERLHKMNQKSITHNALYMRLAKKITDSNEFFEWIENTIEDPAEDELSIQLEFTLQRIILKYIKDHFADLIEDRIYDYLDFQDLRKDPHTYHGVSEKNIVGVG